MRRVILVIALFMFCAASPFAQAPEGWRVRIDRSQSAQDPDDTPDLKVTAVGSGMRVTGGPAGTLWNPAHAVKGNYTVKANFALQKPSSHRNYYGLIFGGSNLDGANQSYVYFLVAQDGTYIIRRRTGDNVADVQTGTPHASVRRPDEGGRSVNALEVRVAGDTISYVVNGTVVHTTPKSGPTAMTDGLVGVRINHQLDVQVDGFERQTS
jgi:hypothetical protein